MRETLIDLEQYFLFTTHISKNEIEKRYFDINKKFITSLQRPFQLKQLLITNIGGTQKDFKYPRQSEHTDYNAPVTSLGGDKKVEICRVLTDHSEAWVAVLLFHHCTILIGMFQCHHGTSNIQSHSFLKPSGTNRCTCYSVRGTPAVMRDVYCMKR